jgi:uncharacterized protein (TIGR02265 family)
MDPTPVVPIARIARPRMPDAAKMIMLPLSIRLKSFAKFMTPSVHSQLEEEFAPYLNQPQYPVIVGNQLVDRVCAMCLAEYERGAAQQLLGQCYIERYQESLIGRLLLAPLEADHDFEWALRGLPRNYAAATNFGTYWVAQLGPQHWRFDFEDDPGYPDFILGTLIAGSEILHIPGYRVSYTLPEPGHMSFDIRWE